MEHVLDNPAWSALISGNSNLAHGNDEVKYFDAAVSPFVGMKENSADHLLQLHDLLPHNSPVIFIDPVEKELPARWNILRKIHCLQMIYKGPATPVASTPELVPLIDAHLPQMLALTKLTNPGPFAERTIDFGHYQGIFDGERLVAMAGQRIHAFNYAEISAVCTHPDYLGKGYARHLLLFQANRIMAASEIPYLHVRKDNYRAISVYESLGFETRRELYFHVMQKG